MASRPVLWFALAAGIAASVLGSLAWRDSERDQSGERLAQASGELSERLSEDVREHDQLLLGTAGLFSASNNVTQAEFSQYAAAVELTR